MRIVLQRVKEASVSVENMIIGRISAGLLLFLGIGKNDGPQDVSKLVTKVSELRIFDDPQGKMNVSAQEVRSEFLVVSQFTLYGDCRKGRRPSFDEAADPQKGEMLYNLFVEELKKKGFKVETGRFRAMMDVALVNDGPVTLIIDSK